MVFHKMIDSLLNLICSEEDYGYGCFSVLKYFLLSQINIQMGIYLSKPFVG